MSPFLVLSPDFGFQPAPTYSVAIWAFWGTHFLLPKEAGHLTNQYTAPLQQIILQAMGQSLTYLTVPGESLTIRPFLNHGLQRSAACKGAGSVVMFRLA